MNKELQHGLPEFFMPYFPQLMCKECCVLQRNDIDKHEGVAPPTLRFTEFHLVTCSRYIYNGRKTETYEWQGVL